ncbi:MAG: glutaminyl-peptide cyclotransferase [Gemmatimonadales bacterium]
MKIKNRAIGRPAIPRRVVVFVAAVLAGCSGNTATLDYVIVRELPHDTTAYTQGFLYANGHFYESTGLLGLSQLRRVNPGTGEVDAGVSLPADRFGEGLALLEDRLYQLTWKSRVGYVYEAATLALVDSFSYAGEGWGLATDGTSLIMSDGTAQLRFVDPADFQVIRQVAVKDKGLPLSQINELEYVNGELFANIYRSDWIVRIDPRSGEVLGWIDLARLLPESRRTAATDVLNGIAFDDESGHFFLTGKLWPTVFELRFQTVVGDSVVGGKPARKVNSSLAGWPSRSRGAYAGIIARMVSRQSRPFWLEGSGW